MKNKFKKTRIIVRFSIFPSILFSLPIYVGIPNLYPNNLYRCATICGIPAFCSKSSCWERSGSCDRENPAVVFGVGILVSLFNIKIKISLLAFYFLIFSFIHSIYFFLLKTSYNL